ncbi:MAG TPA: WD40 repeat domain-containing protein [Candidatus Kapabacteria bacterium]|jgi:WD40 repeat protein|nr:WD40 repeat domain-containing protein [Candidatus Kapabacteria bacterium]
MTTRLRLLSLVTCLLAAMMAIPVSAQWGELVWARRSPYASSILGFPDASTIVTSVSGILRRWSYPQGELLATYTEQYPATGLRNGRSIAPDGRLMAWVLRGDSLALREVATGRVVAAVPGYKPWQAVFTSDGQRLIVLNSLGIVIYAVPSLAAIRLIKENAAGGIALSADDETIAHVDGDGVTTWSTATGELRWSSPLIGAGGSIVAYVDSGRAIAAFNGESIRLVDAVTGDSLARFWHGYSFSHMAFVEGGRYGVTLSASNAADTALRVWDLTTRRHVRDLAIDTTLLPFYHLVAAPDDRSIIVSSGDGRFRQLDIATGATIASLPGSIDRQHLGTAIARNGDVSAVSTTRGVTLLRTSTGETLARIALPGFPRENPMALTNQGHLLAVVYPGVGGFQRLGIFTVASGMHAVDLNLDIRAATAVAFLDDGARILVAQEDGGLSIFAPRPVPPELVLPKHPKGIVALAVSSDERLIATADGEHVRIFDRAGTLQVVRRIGTSSQVQQMAFAAGDTALLVAGPAASLLRFGLSDPADTPPAVVHTSKIGVWSVAVTPDRRYVLIGSDGVLALDPTTFAEQFRFFDPLAVTGWTSARIDAEGRILIHTFDITMWHLPQQPSAIPTTPETWTPRAVVSIDHAGERARVTVPGQHAGTPSVVLHDPLGRRIAVPVQTETSGDALLDISRLPGGSYFVVVSVDGRYFPARFALAR